MSEENGDGQIGANGQRDSRGRFLDGHANLSPGRPPGSLDFMAVCRRKAAEAGIDLEDYVWEVTMAMVEAAKAGDAACAKIVLDRMCGVTDRPSPMMAVQMNIATTNITEQTREDMLALIADAKNQSAVFDELDRRTNG